MAQHDTSLDDVLAELRQNFSRALELDIARLRSQFDSVTAENRALRRELDELRQAVGMLRQIASEHEERLLCAESPRRDLSTHTQD